MSSKSRKHSGRESEASRAKPSSGEPVKPDAESSGLDIPEKYLKTPPRKMSRLTYGFLIFFLIFILVAWVGGGFGSFSSLSSKARDEDYLTWTRPGHGRTVVTAIEFQGHLRAFQQAFQLDPLLPISLGLLGRNLEAEDVARILVLSVLAEDAGIRITDSDLAEHIQGMLEIFRRPVEVYHQMARELGGAECIEGTLRRALLAERFMQLVSFAGAMPSIEAVKDLWNEDHEELAFDYVEVAASDFTDEAQAETPDDAALEAWLAEQPPRERSTFELPERRALEVAAYRDPATTPAAGLLQAFPPEEGVDPEERANDYYERVFARRFVKPAPADEPPAAEARMPEYLGFEEVREACLAEAPIFEALQAWLADLQGRQTAGETIDLAAEAQKHGLAFSTLPPTTRAELEANSDLGGKSVSDAAFFTPPESFAYTVAIDADRLAVVRVRERVEPALPPFTEIRERVAARWVEIRSAALAEEKLRALWQSFEVLEREAEPTEEGPMCRRASEEAFRSALEALGFQVARRDHLDKGGNPGADPLREERAHQFLARMSEYTRLEDDEVAEPRASQDGNQVYLVRLAGRRPVSIDRMSPGQYTALKQRARERARAETFQGFDFDFLKRTYGLEFGLGDEPPPSEEEAGPDGVPLGGS